MPSSRTPDGTPNRCLICGSDVVIAPSTFPANDAPCPVCGSLLWFAAPAESTNRTESRFRILPQSANSRNESVEQPGASAPRSTATVWGKLAAVEIEFKVPRAIGMFGCGLLLMGCIELLLWAYSGDAPGLDGRLAHLVMGVLVCGCAEFFRTDGRHSRWRVMELRLGLIIACVAMLACALTGSHFGQMGLSNAVFVLVISLLMAMGVLFLTVGSLAIVDQAIELLWDQCSGSRLHRDFRRWVQIGRYPTL